MDFQYINQQQRNELQKSLDLIQSVFSKINFKYEEYPSIGTALYQLKRAINMLDIDSAERSETN